jgi:2-polyprenyl-3-methyl-5-hydroxy-6-metoxy-1,4-benzoquinol methylase
MGEYKDYSWSSSDFSHAHAYLLSSLVRLIPNKNEPILDVGCGNGAIANYLIENGYNVYGIDASKTGITIANQKNPGRFFIQDLSKDDLPTSLHSIKFKTIISTEVVEHLYNPAKYVDFCREILLRSNGGFLIISTPYHGYLKNLLLSVFNAWDKHFTVFWVGGHIKFWSFKTLSGLLKASGFQVKKFEGCGRIPYLWKSMIVMAEITK